MKFKILLVLLFSLFSNVSLAVHWKKVSCGDCDGHGKIKIVSRNSGNYYYESCRRCKGSGYVMAIDNAANSREVMDEFRRKREEHDRKMLRLDEEARLRQEEADRQLRLYEEKRIHQQQMEEFRVARQEQMEEWFASSGTSMLKYYIRDFVSGELQLPANLTSEQIKYVQDRISEHKEYDERGISYQAGASVPKSAVFFSQVGSKSQVKTKLKSNSKPNFEGLEELDVAITSTLRQINKLFEEDGSSCVKPGSDGFEAKIKVHKSYIESAEKIINKKFGSTGYYPGLSTLCDELMARLTELKIDIEELEEMHSARIAYADSSNAPKKPASHTVDTNESKANFGDYISSAEKQINEIAEDSDGVKPGTAEFEKKIKWHKTNIENLEKAINKTFRDKGGYSPGLSPLFDGYMMRLEELKKQISELEDSHLIARMD